MDKTKVLTIIMVLVLGLPLSATILTNIDIPFVIDRNCTAVSWQGYNISSSGLIVETAEDVSFLTILGVRSSTTEFSIDDKPAVLNLITGASFELGPMEVLEDLGANETEGGLHLIHSWPTSYSGNEAACGLFTDGEDDGYILIGSVGDSQVIMIAPDKQMFEQIRVVPEQ